MVVVLTLRDPLVPVPTILMSLKMPRALTSKVPPARSMVSPSADSLEAGANVRHGWLGFWQLFPLASVPVLDTYKVRETAPAGLTTPSTVKPPTSEATPRPR